MLAYGHFKLIFLIFLVFSVVITLRLYYQQLSLFFKNIPWYIENRETTPREKKPYINECLDLYEDLKNPNQSNFHRPVLRKPPLHLMNEFTQNGEMPITRYWYFNAPYVDAKNINKTVYRYIYPKEYIDRFRLIGGKRIQRLAYTDGFLLEDMMFKYSPVLKGIDSNFL
jgi:hypothetical protein